MVGKRIEYARPNPPNSTSGDFGRQQCNDRAIDGRRGS